LFSGLQFSQKLESDHLFNDDFKGRNVVFPSMSSSFAKLKPEEINIFVSFGLGANK